MKIDKKVASSDLLDKYYPRTGIIVDGEVFPFSLSCEEYDEYLRFLEARKNEKKDINNANK